MTDPLPTIAPDERAALIRCGLSRLEIDALEAVAAAAYHILRLPELHPSERAEATARLHRLQNDILARAGTRALGWPRG